MKLKIKDERPNFEIKPEIVVFLQEGRDAFAPLSYTDFLLFGRIYFLRFLSPNFNPAAFTV